MNTIPFHYKKQSVNVLSWGQHATHKCNFDYNIGFLNLETCDRERRCDVSMRGKIVAIILHAAKMRGYVCSPLEMQNPFTYSLYYETDALLCYNVTIFMHV